MIVIVDLSRDIKRIQPPAAPPPRLDGETDYERSLRFWAANYDKMPQLRNPSDIFFLKWSHVTNQRQVDHIRYLCSFQVAGHTGRFIEEDLFDGDAVPRAPGMTYMRGTYQYRVLLGNTPSSPSNSCFLLRSTFLAGCLYVW
jgi:hypothetical protein